jgi:hypothetical protein
MNIGISYHKFNEEFVATVTTKADTLEEFNRELGSDEEPAVALIVDSYPAKYRRAIHVLESLVNIDSGEGTICEGLEAIVETVYARGDADGYARGRADAMAHLELIADMVVAKLAKAQTA